MVGKYLKKFSEHIETFIFDFSDFFDQVPDITNHHPYSYISYVFFTFFPTSSKTTNENMFFVYRKISNIFPRNNHDQHDVIDHDHDHETTTGFIKVDNQPIFIKKFVKKHT